MIDRRDFNKGILGGLSLAFIPSFCLKKKQIIHCQATIEYDMWPIFYQGSLNADIPKEIKLQVKYNDNSIKRFISKTDPIFNSSDNTEFKATLINNDKTLIISYAGGNITLKNLEKV